MMYHCIVLRSNGFKTILCRNDVYFSSDSTGRPTEKLGKLFFFFMVFHFSVEGLSRLYGNVTVVYAQSKRRRIQNTRPSLFSVFFPRRVRVQRNKCARQRVYFVRTWLRSESKIEQYKFESPSGNRNPESSPNNKTNYSTWTKLRILQVINKALGNSAKSVIQYDAYNSNEIAATCRWFTRRNGLDNLNTALSLLSNVTDIAV